jgi:hypothetical protein
MAGSVGVGRRGILVFGAVTVGAACTPPLRGANGEKNTVRTDVEPLERRFTAFGPLSDAHWLGTALGQDARGSAPGPTDVRVVGTAQLRAGVGAAIVGAPQWHFRPDQPGPLPEELASFMPKSARWVRSESFDEEVTGGAYPGAFYLRIDADQVYFDTTNPSTPAGLGP